MPWNSLFPLGTVSVKSNKAIGQQNTTYIEVTMGNDIIGTNAVTTRDHFWDVGANEDGRHRFIQSPAFTVGGNPDDPVVGTGMDGVLYLKTVNSDVARVEGFYRNSNGIYQYIPSFISGSKVISSTNTYVTLETIPINVYGEIFIWQDTTAIMQYGTFMTSATICEGYSSRIKLNGTSDDYLIELRNVTSASLDLQARRGSGANATWNYRITYRAI